MGSVKNILIAIVAALLIGALGFSYGWFQGKSSCRSINADIAEKSVDLSQAAVRRTSQFNLDTLSTAADLKAKINEVQDDSLDIEMSGDLVDLLNK